MMKNENMSRQLWKFIKLRLLYEVVIMLDSFACSCHEEPVFKNDRDLICWKWCNGRVLGNFEHRVLWFQLQTKVIGYTFVLILFRSRPRVNICLSMLKTKPYIHILKKGVRVLGGKSINNNYTGNWTGGNLRTPEVVR